MEGTGPMDGVNARELFAAQNSLTYDDLILLQGRFPLVSQIGISGGENILVALPREARCEQVTPKGVGSIEFRPSGERVLSLVAADGLCPVFGVVRAPGVAG